MADAQTFDVEATLATLNLE